MKYRQLFAASFREPKKLAAFRLLPIGKVISYVFLFVWLFAAVSFIRFLFGDVTLFEASPDLIEYSRTIGILIYPIAFVFQVVISTFYIFVRVSIFAAIGLLIVKLMKRRAEYRHVWRTAAVSITFPLLMTLALDFIPMLEGIGLYLSSAVHLIYMILALRYYPKMNR